MHRRSRREQVELPGEPLERRALDDRRDDDDEEHGIEDRVRVRHVLRREHEGREHDRDRTAEPGPPEQGALAIGEGAERRRGPHGCGSDQEHQQQRQGQTGQSDVRQVLREHEQAEHDEERDLRQEREPFVEGDELASVAGRRAADGEADEVDGEEAAAADHVRGAEGERSGGDGRDWSKRADRVGHAREHPRRSQSEHDANQEPEPDLLYDQHREVVETVRSRASRSTRSGRASARSPSGRCRPTRPRACAPAGVGCA